MQAIISTIAKTNWTTHKTTFNAALETTIWAANETANYF